MKKVALLLILFFSIADLTTAQKLISKTHCLRDYFFEVSTSCILSDNTSIMLGTFHPETSLDGIHLNMFMTRLDDKGAIIWSKKITFPFNVENAKS